MNRQISVFISLTIVCLSFAQVIHAQEDLEQSKDFRYSIMASLSSQGFALSLTDVVITSHHYDDGSHMTYAYYNQIYQGIEVYKAIGNMVMGSHGKSFKNSRLVKDALVFQPYSSGIGPEESVERVARHLDLPLYKSKGKLYKSKDGRYKITGLPYAKDVTHIRKVWAKKNAGSYTIGWAIELAPSVSPDNWEVVVDASDGTILYKINNTLYCNWEEDGHAHSSEGIVDELEYRTEVSQSTATSYVVDGSKYQVFAPPLESPGQGGRSLVQDPADVMASPFGWHDTDGVAGPEFTTLRGNNVHAYQDTAGSNTPGQIQPSAIDGLTFDFPFDEDATPVENLNADLTNIFFWNNYLHDWSFKFGFNEAAGNFQQTNYTNQGTGNDAVLAETLDGSDTNNANFSAPRDGSNGRMQMYKWIIGNDFDILSPQSIQGTFTTGNSSFGPSLSTPLEGQIALAMDGTGVTTDACEPITNGGDLRGKVALIDRGTCDFSFKVYAAQESGAIACLICNNQANAPLVTMAAGDSASLVTIPSLFLSKEDCDIIKSRVNEGVTGRFNETRELSSAFDNGIVVHEFGHGISLRLSGGRLTSGCLTNDEQMGEGWSDFFTLVLTQLPDDTGEMSRGIGTYVTGQARSGRGIRRFPYSTDMAINPQVHSHIRFSFRPHDVGEIWTTVLWDMYWDFIDIDGYDPTWTDVNKGNLKAIQLVFDGMKLQECDPSLIEARDAILEADRLNNLGENECLIWTAFARRGLGIDALANNSDSRYDNVDGFRRPLSCEGTLTISKEMTPMVSPGDEIEVVISIANFKESMSGVVVTDEIPDGTTVSDITIGTGDVAGSIISFDIGELALGDSRELRYRLSTEGINYAEFDIYDDLEGAVNFDRTTTNTSGRGWALSTAQSNSGVFSLGVLPDTLGGNSYAARSESFTISERNRLLRFDHRYEMDLGIDGGIVEVSTDQGQNWTAIGKEKFLVNGMPDNISNCFNNCPNPDFFYRNVQDAFTGQRDWHTSVIDLSDYMGQEILIRFNHISLTFRESLYPLGWFVDDFELYEKRELAGTACISSGGVEVACNRDATLINSDARSVPVTEVQTENIFFAVSPNPADDHIVLRLNAQERFDGVIRVIGIDGRVMVQRSLSVNAGENRWNQPITGLQSGMYFIELTHDKKRYAVAFIKQ